MGLAVNNQIKINAIAVTNPTVTDDRTQGYTIGSIWYNAGALRVYICVNDTTGAAVWSDLTSTATTGSFQGFWDASSNSPTIADGAGSNGDYYFVSTAGTQDLGSGSISFGTGDMVINDSLVWTKIAALNLVSSVFGRLGAIVATNGDYTAAQITNEAAGNITSITVQAAIDELDSQDTVIAGDLSTHIADVTNPHAVTQTQVGLSNVDNTSDINKPISTATQTALDLKQDGFIRVQEVPAGDKDSVNTEFTISNTPNSNSLSVFLNGLLQIENNDFTISGVIITFAIAPDSEDKLLTTFNY